MKDNSADKAIERAWFAQYSSADDAAIAKGLAARIGDANPALALRARIVEADWGARFEPGATDRAALFADAAAKAERAGDYRYAAIARYGQAIALESSVGHDSYQELALSREALDLCLRLDEPPDFDKAVFVNGIAIHLRHSGDWSGALERYYEAAALALKSGAMTLLVAVKNNLGTLLFAGGYLNDSEQAYESAYATAKERKLDHMIQVIARNLAEVRLKLGRAEDALAIVEPLLAKADATPARGGTIFGIAAVAAVSLGRKDAAARWASKAVDLAERSRIGTSEALAYMASGRVEMALGKISAAKEWFLRSKEAAEKSGELVYRIDAAEALADLAVKSGDNAEAAIRLDEEFALRSELVGDPNVAATSREGARERVNRPAFLDLSDFERAKRSRRIQERMLLSLMARRVGPSFEVDDRSATPFEMERLSDLVALMRRLSYGMGTNRVSARGVLDEATARVRARFGDRALAMEIDGDQELECNGEALVAALELSIGSSLASMGEGGSTFIRAFEDGDRVRFEVRTTDSGARAEERDVFWETASHVVLRMLAGSADRSHDGNVRLTTLMIPRTPSSRSPAAQAG